LKKPLAENLMRPGKNTSGGPETVRKKAGGDENDAENAAQSSVTT
jgi:hypothetical protein